MSKGHPRATVSIICPSSVTAGTSATCHASYTGTLVSGFWTVNGVEQINSEDKTSITWENPPVGTYTIQAIAIDNYGNIIVSNKVVSNIIMPPVFCLVPAGYTPISCSKLNSPLYTRDNLHIQWPSRQWKNNMWQ